MKNIKKYSKVFFLLSLVLMLSDCKKDKFLNVNTNPNYPASVPVNLVLPTCEANIGYMVGNTLGIYGGLWGQYWTQDPTYGSQYGNFDSYLNVPTDNDNVWQALYTTGTNLNFIIGNCDSTEKNYAAIAYFMKAYNFQLLCDGWGNIPLSQALKGVGNLAPSYDPGQQVYDSIESWIYTGLNTIDLTRTSPAEDLVYPNASMSQWQKFANTLLMKVYIRECLANPGRATTGFAKLNASMSATGTGFMSIPPSVPGVDIGGDDAALYYTAVTFQQFPLYATQVYLQVQNLNASATVVNYMLSLNDPRIVDFFTPPSNAGGVYSGELQGDYKALSGQPNSFAAISAEIISPTSTQRLLTASESDFLQAEAALRGYLPGGAGAAAGLYAKGVAASFQSWSNSSTASVSTYLAQNAVNFSNAGSTAAQLNLVLTQKWASMCGNQNFEAWTEWRRTGIPTFFTLSPATQIAAGKFPERLVYPSAELNDNTSFPGEQPIYAPVWWDINP